MIEFFYHTVWKWQPFWLDEGELRERWRGKENLRGGRRVPTCLCSLSQPDHRSGRNMIEITAKWYKTERHGHFSHGESQEPEDPFMSCPAPRQQSHSVGWEASGRQPEGGLSCCRPGVGKSYLHVTHQWFILCRPSGLCHDSTLLL